MVDYQQFFLIMGIAAFIITVILVLGLLWKVYKTPTWRKEFIETLEASDSPFGTIVVLIGIIYALVFLTLVFPVIMISLLILIFLGFYIGYKIHKKHEEDSQIDKK